MTASHSAPAADLDLETEIDLTNCDREPIHALSRIQTFGALIAVTSDWLVRHVSDEAHDVLGLERPIESGHRLADWFEPSLLETLRAQLRSLGSPDAVGRVFSVPVGRPGGTNERRLFDIAIHLSGRSIVLEFERSNPHEPADYLALVRPLISRLESTRDIAELCDLGARQLRSLTGFDRVMVYRFAADDSGDVIAEAVKSTMTPFKGLRYPASDIPKQARALYLRSLLRIISDVNNPGHAVHPPLDADGGTLDLSLSATRAVSPIHLEYLKNMGVGASMSVSILERGKLWGLFACHHEGPRILSYRLRTTVELYAQMFAFLLEQKERANEAEERERAQTMHDTIVADVADGAPIADSFEHIVNEIASVIPHDGAVAWIDGEYRAVGDAPGYDDFLQIARFLNTTTTARVYHTDCLKDVFEPARDMGDEAAGLLALPVSRNPRDYIVLFRSEIARSLVWGGNPDKPVERDPKLGPNGTRLTPRKSFEAYRQTVRGRSEPWTRSQVRTAEHLRTTLLEVVLRITDASNKDLARAQEAQELLIAELNHRVRNILNLIKGLVDQSGHEGMDVGTFTEVIGGRINALARAHDQITRESWSAASLHELIETEVAAYVADNPDRVRITGDDVMLHPAAFSTVALVVHELMTNAAKYGALSQANNGTVEVDIERTADGSVRLRWRERGGPPVQAPKRRGFGTTIIEHSIPFELRGKAETRFDVTGFSGDFLIPATNVTEVVPAPKSSSGDEESDVLDQPLGRILIVEDNMIIGMDAEDMMFRQGAEGVDVVGQVSTALRLIETETFDGAMLDINLGIETSEPVAHQLAGLGVPFIFTTGYGETTELSTTFPDVPVVSKPYEATQIRRALSAAIGSQKPAP